MTMNTNPMFNGQMMAAALMQQPQQPTSAGGVQSPGAGLYNGISNGANMLMQASMANQQAQQSGQPLPFPALGGMFGMGQGVPGSTLAAANQSSDPMGTLIGAMNWTPGNGS